MRSLPLTFDVFTTIVRPATPSVTIMIKIVIRTVAFLVSFIRAVAIADSISSSNLRIIGMVCFLAFEKHKVPTTAVSIGMVSFFIFFLSFQDFFCLETEDVVHNSVIVTGITVIQANAMSLSYRDRGNVMRVVVIVIKRTVVTIVV